MLGLRFVMVYRKLYRRVPRSCSEGEVGGGEGWGGVGGQHGEGGVDT